MLLCRAGGVPDVEVAIDPAELEGLDEEGVRALYEERLAAQQSTASREVRYPAHSAQHPCPACSLTFMTFPEFKSGQPAPSYFALLSRDIALCVGGLRRRSPARSVRG